jgi:hypothetical protein
MAKTHVQGWPTCRARRKSHALPHARCTILHPSKPESHPGRHGEDVYTELRRLRDQVTRRLTPHAQLGTDDGSCWTPLGRRVSPASDQDMVQHTIGTRLADREAASGARDTGVPVDAELARPKRARIHIGCHCDGVDEDGGSRVARQEGDKR